MRGLYSSLTTLLLLMVSTILISPAGAYQNPYDLPNSGGIADPCIIKHLGKYYLYGTKDPAKSGMQCWESTDLVTWTDKGLVTPSSPVDQWAPDVFYYNGTFYMYISNQYLKHLLLTSTSPTGPFTTVNSDICPVNTIDGNAFMDDNGQMYFSYAAHGGIRYRPMSSPTAIDGSESQLTSCVINISNTWTEAPQIFKIDGTYYINYTGNDYLQDSYQVHAGKGSSVAGLTAQNNNPILSETTGSYTGTGHNFVFLGPDLKTYYTAYHTILRTPSYHRKLAIDPLWIDKETGNLYAYGPSFSAQDNPAAPTWSDDFNRTTIGSGWTNEGGGDWGMYGNMLMWGNTKGSNVWKRQISTTQTGDDFVAEFNTKLMSLGTSGYAKFGVFVCYDGGQNDFTVWIDEPNNLVATNAKQEGIDMGWQNSATLRSDWDHTKWETIRVEKKGAEFKIFLNNLLVQERHVNLKGGKLGVILEDCHADFGYCAFSNLDVTEKENWDYEDIFNRTTLGSEWTPDNASLWGVWDSKLMWGNNKGTDAWNYCVNTAATSDDYILEATVRQVGSAGTTAAYPKYGVATSYFVDGSGLDLFTAWVDPGTNLIATGAYIDNIEQTWVNSSTMPTGTNYELWHTMRVEKRDTDFKIFFDGDLAVQRTLALGGGAFASLVNDMQSDFGLFRYRDIVPGYDWVDDFERTSIGSDWAGNGTGNWGLWNEELMYGDTTQVGGWGWQTAQITISDNYRITGDMKMVTDGSQTYSKYGLIGAYDMTKNDYFVAWIDPQIRKVATWGMKGATDLGWLNSTATIPTSVDLSDWHLMTIEKRSHDFTVYVEGTPYITREVEIDGGSFGAVTEDLHADFGFVSYENIEQ